MHYMTKSMWTPARRNISLQNQGHFNMELVTTFAAITASTLLGRLSSWCRIIAAITASTLLGRLSTRCRIIAVGTCFHSATSISEVGQLGLVSSQLSNSSQRCSMGLKQTLSVWTSLCARGLCHCESRKGLPQTDAIKGIELSKMSLYAVALRFPFTGTKGLSPNMKRNSSRPGFLLHQTLQLALCIQADNVLLASAKPRFVHRTAEAWFVTPENAFPLLQSKMAVSFTPLQPTLEWNKVVSVATENRLTCLSAHIQLKSEVYIHLGWSH